MQHAGKWFRRATQRVALASNWNGGAMTDAITDFVNLLLIAGLAIYGLTLFADYSARGRWARNLTSLLASMGILILALALALTPGNAAILLRLSHSEASKVLLGVSSFLLLLSIGAFGLITYSRPFRLRHEKRIERDLNRSFPRIP